MGFGSANPDEPGYATANAWVTKWSPFEKGSARDSNGSNFTRGEIVMTTNREIRQDQQHGGSQ